MQVPLWVCRCVALNTKQGRAVDLQEDIHPLGVECLHGLELACNERWDLSSDEQRVKGRNDIALGWRRWDLRTTTTKGRREGEEPRYREDRFSQFTSPPVRERPRMPIVPTSGQPARKRATCALPLDGALPIAHSIVRRLERLWVSEAG